MFHLAAYYLASGSDVPDTDTPAVVDDILTIQNNHFVLSEQLQLVSAFANGLNIISARVASPSMRQISSPYIRPIWRGATLVGDENVMALDHSPFRIPPYEEIQALTTNAAATTTATMVMIWLTSGMITTQPGNIIPIRFTGSYTSVEGTWQSVPITFSDALPSGVYDAVLSEAFFDDSGAHRWIFSNQTWRPGYLSHDGPIGRLPYVWTKSQLGVMGRFRSNDLPRFQALALATGSQSVEGYLYVQRVGNLV